MSCDHGHPADCPAVLAQVDEFLDGELDDVRRAVVAQHLAECPPCRERVQAEGAVRALVHRCCGCEPAPEHLRVQIVTQIRQISVSYRRYGP
jgi:mycothiol system anti-sigma-R factor